MRAIALLTTLAMSAGTAVYAEPARVGDRNEVRVQVRDRGDANWTRDRYDRYDRSHWAKDFRGRWVTLASGVTAQERIIDVPRGNRYGKLRIEATRGEPKIEKISVEFTNGQTQSVDLGMFLTRGGGEVIDLNGGDRRIRRIVVYPDNHTRGAYALYGA